MYSYFYLWKKLASRVLKRFEAFHVSVKLSAGLIGYSSVD